MIRSTVRTTVLTLIYLAYLRTYVRCMCAASMNQNVSIYNNKYDNITVFSVEVRTYMLWNDTYSMEKDIGYQYGEGIMKVSSLRSNQQFEHSKSPTFSMTKDFITALWKSLKTYMSRNDTYTMEEENICENCENEVEWLNDDDLCEDCENEAGIARMECLNDRD